MFDWEIGRIQAVLLWLKSLMVFFLAQAWAMSFISEWQSSLFGMLDIIQHKLQSWIEKLDFIIGDISSIYQISGGLETKFNTDYRTGGISTAKKSRVKWRVKQRRESVKISDISMNISSIYWGNIADFFVSLKKKIFIIFNKNFNYLF